MREYLRKAPPKPPESDAAVRQTVTEIIAAVRQEGDARRAALLRDARPLVAAELPAVARRHRAGDGHGVGRGPEDHRLLPRPDRRLRPAPAREHRRVRDRAAGWRDPRPAPHPRRFGGGLRARRSLSAPGLRPHEHRDGQGGRRAARDRVLAAEPGGRRGTGSAGSIRPRSTPWWRRAPTRSSAWGASRPWRPWPTAPRRSRAPTWWSAPATSTWPRPSGRSSGSWASTSWPARRRS